MKFAYNSNYLHVQRVWIAMRIRLYKLWEQVTGSFWFVPTFMIGVAIILASLTLSLDHQEIAFGGSNFPWIYSGSPDGARSILSTVASSMISVAGLTFSITMVTLSLASSQLGPRLLNNFTRDTGNQIVLGTFISVFTYCLLILRSVRSLDELSFVPHLSLTTAIILAIISLGVLIYFFHHVSMMMQAQNLIAKIGDEMQAQIGKLLKDDKHTPYEHHLREESDVPTDFEEKASYLTAQTSGFLQVINHEDLLETCQENDLLVKTLYKPGDFVTINSNIMAIYSEHQSIDEDVKEKIHDFFTMGAVRLRLQDIEFSIDQLVEIAVRALSSGINDPFTVIACLDQFSTNLSILARETLPSGYHYDEDNNLRIITDVVNFTGIVNASFNQIRQYGKTDIAVTIRILEVITTILAQTKTDEQRQALIEQANVIKETSQRLITEEKDLNTIMRYYEMVMDISK